MLYICLYIYGMVLGPGVGRGELLSGVPLMGDDFWTVNKEGTSERQKF